MNEFDQNWWRHFIPECYFDTILLSKILKADGKRLLHRKGCNNVINDLNSRLAENFAVAMVDKDKNELDYLQDCAAIYNENKIILWKHNNRKHFVLQLNPPLERWIIELLDENNYKIEDFGYSRNYKILKRQIKGDIDKESDEKLNKLVNAVIKIDCKTIRKVKAILEYLKRNNYQFDINELINV